MRVRMNDQLGSEAPPVERKIVPRLDPLISQVSLEILESGRDLVGSRGRATRRIPSTLGAQEPRERSDVQNV